MNMSFKSRRSMAALLSLLVLALSAGIPRLATAMDGLMLDDAWSRPLPPTAANGAAYLVIHNHGAHADRLVGGSSDIAERVEVHDHVMDGDLMKMVRLEGADIPAGEVVTFKPHGLHVMLLGLTRPLVEGEQYTLTLEFEQAGNQEITVVVEDRGMGDMQHGEHGEHGDHGEKKHEEHGGTGS